MAVESQLDWQSCISSAIGLLTASEWDVMCQSSPNSCLPLRRGLQKHPETETHTHTCTLLCQRIIRSSFYSRLSKGAGGLNTSELQLFGFRNQWRRRLNLASKHNKREGGVTGGSSFSLHFPSSFPSLLRSEIARGDDNRATTAAKLLMEKGRESQEVPQGYQ